jgi:hypothetical protein
MNARSKSYGAKVGFCLVLGIAAGAEATACDNGPTKLDRLTEAAAAPPAATSAAPRPPPMPFPPTISVDDSACTINGEEILFMNADARDRIAAMLTGKPLVEGKDVAFDAARETKTPKVTAVVWALRKAKAKGATIHTPMRDRSPGELTLPFSHPPAPECTPVAMISRDGSIAVWSAGGGVAQKFTKGFAGPDLTLGTEGLKRAAQACASSAFWVLGADDNITWGLTFDLAMRARGDSDGGAGPMHSAEVVLASEPPVPGRKVEVP